MNEEVFRKKSLDKVKSPENLDEYIRVSNPGIWLLLISIIVLLAGAFVWGIFGRIESTVPVSVRIEDGAAVCYITDDAITAVQEGMTVRFSDCEAVISGIGKKEESGYVCELAADFSANDGFYEGKVVIESSKPLSFILN